MFIIKAINKLKEVHTDDAELSKALNMAIKSLEVMNMIDSYDNELYDIRHRYETFIESQKEVE